MEHLLLTKGDTVLWRSTRMQVIGVAGSHPDEKNWWPKYRLADPEHPEDDFIFSQRHVDGHCKKLMEGSNE